MSWCKAHDDFVVACSEKAFVLVFHTSKILTSSICTFIKSDIKQL